MSILENEMHYVYVTYESLSNWHYINLQNTITTTGPPCVH